MAHMKAFKRSGVAALLAHYERVAELEHGYRRDNIDPSRTAENYNLRPRDARAAIEAAVAIHERSTGKRIRRDANVICDWVVTLPRDCPPEKSRDFFEAVATFMESRYGKENVLGCYVHVDEKTPHVHVPILPLLDGKLLASKVMTRAELRSFHPDLNRAVDEALGFHVSIQLDEEQRQARAGKYVELAEYKDACAATDAAVAKAEFSELAAEMYIELARARVSQAVESVEETETELAEKNAQLDSLTERVEAKEGELADATEELEAARAKTNEQFEKAYAAGSQATRAAMELRELEGQVKEKRDELRGIEDMIGKAVGWLAEVAGAWDNGWKAFKACLEAAPQAFESIARKALQAGEPWRDWEDAERAADVVDEEFSIGSLGAFLEGSRSLSDGTTPTDRGNGRRDH